MNQHVRGTIIQAVVLIAAGSILFFVFHHAAAAIVVVSLGAVITVLSLASPAFARGVEAVRGFITRLVSTLVTWLLLVPFYYLCFVPGRLIQLLTGKDPMERKFPGNVRSYWKPYVDHPDPNHWKRQF